MALRSPKYVALSVLSGSIRVNGGAPSDFDLGAGSPSCVSVSGGRACTIAVPAPPGADTFTLLLKDGPFISNLSTGTPVSAASGFAATVREGKANTSIPLVLGGVLDHGTITVVQPAAYQFTGTSGQLVVTGFDHSNGIIIAPGSYVDATGAPVTISMHVYASDAMTLSLNGAAPVVAVTTGSASDVITIHQIAARMGSRVVAQATNNVPITAGLVTPAYSATNIAAVANLLETPGPIQGGIGKQGTIAGVDGTGTDAFTYDGSTLLSCTTSGAVDATPSYTVPLWFITGGGLFTATNAAATPVACNGAQAGNGTTASVTLTSLQDATYTIVPGTISSACTATVQNSPLGSWALSGSSCTNPRYLTSDFFSGALSFIFTSSGGDEIGYSSGLNQPGNHVVIGGSGNISAIVADQGSIYALNTSTNALTQYGEPPGAQLSTYPLPAYVPACQTQPGNQRRMTLGDNGNIFIALGGAACTQTGVLEVTVSGTVVHTFANITQVMSVATDKLGRIYWDDLNHELVQYP